MSLQINTNVTALKSARQLNQSHRRLTNSMEKLSSGKRINKSADDVAGMAVSENLRARLRSLDVAKRNASDALSFIQVAEGGLNEVTNIVVRMRELATQAASDTLDNHARSLVDKEFQQLKIEAARIVETAEYNGTKVLSPTENALQLFIGASYRGIRPDGSVPDYSEGDSDILEVDFSELYTLKESMDAILEEGMAVVPEDLDGSAMDLGSVGTQEMLSRLDTGLEMISGYRATLGSYQSRIDTAINNIDVSSENLNAAKSRIVDVDYASETAKYTLARILTQAGVSVQAQASSDPEMVVQLLNRNF